MQRASAFLIKFKNYKIILNLLLTNQKCFAIIVWQSRKLITHRDVAQLVARMVWDHDAVGSNPIISTIKTVYPLGYAVFIFVNGGKTCLLR